jgi:hypothetical protein
MTDNSIAALVYLAWTGYPDMTCSAQEWRSLRSAGLIELRVGHWAVTPAGERLLAAIAM